MAENAAARIAPAGRLRVSRAPVAEIAAAAQHAQEAASLEGAGADFIVLAVPSGAGDDALATLLENTADAHIAATLDAERAAGLRGPAA